MTATANARTVMKAIQAQGQRKVDPVEYKEMSVDQIHWQGDVGIMCIEKVPSGFREVTPMAQLAQGTSRGARHVIHESCEYRMFMPPRGFHDITQGPIVVPKTKLIVVHPDHGTATFPPDHVYSIRYQRQITPSGQQALVRD